MSEYVSENINSAASSKRIKRKRAAAKMA